MEQRFNTSFLWNNSTTQLNPDPAAQPKPILNDELYLTIMFILLGVICQTVTVFGVGSNILNLIVFIKQGPSDSINVSLLALTIADLCSLIFIMWTNLCFSPAFRDSDIPMVTLEVQLMSGSWPHVIFTRTTGLITAFISLERCVCVILPLKVKTIFTHRRHVVVMVTFFVVTIGCASSAYRTAGLGWRFFPERNKTLIGLAFYMHAHKKITDSFNFAVNGVLMPVTCFLSVVVFSSVLVVKLNQKATWRSSNSSTFTKTATKSNTDGGITIKEKKVAKMVVMISVIFIACFIPAVVTFISSFFEPRLSYDGLYKNLFLVTLSVSFTTEAINSSINIFVYFTMSTKYRRTVMRMFKLTKYMDT